MSENKKVLEPIIEMSIVMIGQQVYFINNLEFVVLWVIRLINALQHKCDLENQSTISLQKEWGRPGILINEISRE